MFGKRYEIPVTFFVQVDDDPELIELGQLGIPYPYDAKTALPQLLRELAAGLEEHAANDKASGR
jgi:hypothetical protein